MRTHEALTPGEAVAGMILKGLGLANRPVSLTPQLFANTPLALLCREGLRAEMFNRVKLGRTRDEAYAYGGDRLCHELALAVCAQAGMDLRVNHLDTTSVARPGEDVPDSDEQAMPITDGSAKEHRPDRKHAGLEGMVVHEGGVPFRSKRGEGHTAALQVVQERAPALLAAFQKAPSPRYRLADSKLDHEDNAPQPPTPRLYHPDSPPPELGLPGDHAGPRVGHLASVR